jgi:hypothetical protein
MKPITWELKIQIAIPISTIPKIGTNSFGKSGRRGRELNPHESGDISGILPFFLT